MRRSLLLHSLLALAALAYSACAPGPQEFGILEGHVTIGPLVPVVRDGEEEPTPAPEAYAAREIVVLMLDGMTVVARIQIDAKGNYRAELPAGIYIVDINRVGIDSAADLPKEIEIASQRVTKLDIDIDTGIR